MRTEPKTIRAYAVVGRKGNPVVQENNHLHPLLVFTRKNRAMEAIYASGERVVRVSITIEE